MTVKFLPGRKANTWMRISGFARGNSNMSSDADGRWAEQCEGDTNRPPGGWSWLILPFYALEGNCEMVSSTNRTSFHLFSLDQANIWKMAIFLFQANPRSWSVIHQGSSQPSSQSVCLPPGCSTDSSSAPCHSPWLADWPPRGWIAKCHLRSGTNSPGSNHCTPSHTCFFLLSASFLRTLDWIQVFKMSCITLNFEICCTVLLELWGSCGWWWWWSWRSTEIQEKLQV